MKLKTILSLAIMTLLFATSCSDDEKQPTVNDVVGTYQGYTVASCAYFDNMVAADQSISVTANEDGTARVALTSDTWGEFVVPNATFTANSNVYTLSGSGTTVMGMGGNDRSYDCTFVATIKGADDAEMAFTVPSVMGGLTVTFKTGEAPATEE